MHFDTHLSDAELHDLLLGKLPDAAEGAAESHLAECPACQARAATARSCDTFVQLVTAAGTRVAAARAAAATPQPESPTDAAATQVSSGPPIVLALVGAPAGLVAHSRYKLVRRLGAGGMGDVWLAEHAVMGRPVALKVIRPEFLARPGAVERFRREVRAVAALHHPNIVAAFAADEADGTHFLVMEYVDGEALSEVVRRGPLPVADACRAVRDAARGLAHAHAAGLVHRDIKPANLIRATDGATKVLDFGLVGAGEETAGLTGANMVMGTPDYIAPEQATDARSADARSDVYSLGCTLYHLLAGRVPFPGDSTLQKLDAHRDPARTPEPVANIPAKLARVLTRIMAKDPAARYQTAEAVADALDRFCVTLDEDAPTVAAPAPTRPRSKRRFAVAAGLLFALVAAAGAAVVQHRIKTDTGELVIETTGDDVEVVVKQGGKVVEVYDTKTKQKLVLKSGVYEFEVNGKATGLTLDIDRATLKRGDVVVAKITREKAPTAKPAEIEPAKPVRLQELTTLKQKGNLYHLDFSPDGKRLSVRGDGVAIWNTETGKVAKEFTDEKVLWLSTRGDGKAVACYSETAGEGWVNVRDLVTGAQLHRVGPVPPRGCWGVHFTPDGNHLLICVHELIYRATLKTEAIEKVITGPQWNEMRFAEFSPDGTKLLIPDTTFTLNGQREAVLLVREYPSLRVVGRIPLPGLPQNSVHMAKWTRHGTAIVGILHTGELIGIDWPGDKKLFAVKAHESEGNLAAFADGGRFASISNDGWLRVWDSLTGKKLGEVRTSAAMWGVAVSPDGKVIATGATNGEVKLWSVTELDAPKP